MQGSSIAGTGSSDGSNGNLLVRAYAKKVHDAHLPSNNGGIAAVMVSITALPGITEQHSPVDLVVILHIREDTSLPRNWEDLLKEAMDVIVDNLHGMGRLAVIPGQSALMTPPPKFPSIKIPYATTSLVATLESAELILHGRKQEDKKKRAGHIVVISNSNDDTSPLLAWRFPSIHAFGFRDAHNARAMHSIASSHKCTYAVLDDSLGRITLAFIAAIRRITSAGVAAMPIEVKLMCEQTVFLTAVNTPGLSYYISYDKKACIMWPSAHMASGRTTNIVVSLHHFHEQLFTVHVKHGHGNNAVDDKLDVQLVKEGIHGSKEVAAEMVRMEAVKIVATIVTMDDKSDLEQLHVAAHKLRHQWAMLENSSCGREAGAAGLISGLAAQMREMEVRLYNNYYWLEYMLSWHSHQQCQLPLPQPLMEDKQSTNNPPLQLRILAKLDLETTQKGLQVPVMVRVMAPEAGLAMVKRDSIDLIVVIDASYGPKETKKKTQERRQLLEEANKKKKQHNMAKKTVNKSEKRLDRLKSDQITQEMKTMKDEITQERQAMNTLAKEEDKLRAQATELEKDVKKVMENTDKRLDLLAKAIEVVKNKLNVNDRLAIIPVKSSLAEPATDHFATDHFESEISNKVQQLSMPLTYHKAAVQTDESSNALHWWKQTKKTMRLIRDCLHSAPSSSTPIVMSARSQGTASMTAHSPDVGGSTNTLQKALMDATKILDGRQGLEKDRQGFIIVISDSDDDSICMENLSSKYTVHAFGFYGMLNTRAMYHIASSSNGIYNIINDDRNKITEAFTSCINRMTSTIAINTKVEIMCSPSSDVALSTIKSGPFRYSIRGNKTSSSILVGTLSAGTVKNFIVYVDNVHEHDHGNFSKCFQVCVKWMHPLDRKEKLLEGQVFVVRAGIDGYEDVMEIISHVEAVQIASNITDPNYSQTNMVADKLKQMRTKCPEFERSAGDDRLTWLSKEMVKIDKNKHMTVTNSNYYKNMVADRLAYILSWLSYQQSYCCISVL